jgi:REP element-mobilizing transposase RayT
MTRLARMVVPGLPHHVTQRGNRREAIFFEDGDQEIYCDMVAEQLRKSDVEVWAYCLMPNHVHLILKPREADGMGRAFGRSASPIYQLRQCSWPLDRTSVSESVRLGCYGRVAFEGGGIVCQFESGSITACFSSRGVVVVERTCPPCRRG